MFLTHVAAGDVDEYLWNGDYWGRKHKYIVPPLMQAALAKTVPDFLRKQTQGKSVKVYEIDLDSDSRNDYILHYESEIKTCFVKSDGSKQSCEKLGASDGFAYYLFAQLDKTPMLELFALLGDEASNNYRLYTFNPDTWERVELFKISPLLISKPDKNYQGIYWGYPWDIHSLQLKNYKGKIRFPVSVDIKGLDRLAPYMCHYPMIFFSGLPTQGKSPGHFSSLKKRQKWLTLQELMLAIDSITEYKKYIASCVDPEI